MGAVTGELFPCHQMAIGVSAGAELNNVGQLQMDLAAIDTAGTLQVIWM